MGAFTRSVVALAGATAAALLGAGIAGAQELKLAHFMAPTHPYHPRVFAPMQSVLTTFALVMNRDAWNRLPADQKAAVEKATGLAMGERAFAVWNAVSAKGIEAIAAAPGKELIRLAPAEAAKFDAISKNVTENAVGALEAKGIPARKITSAMAVN